MLCKHGVLLDSLKTYLKSKEERLRGGGEGGVWGCSSKVVETIKQ